jgi:hypothetical protein
MLAGVGLGGSSMRAGAMGGMGSMGVMLPPVAGMLPPVRGMGGVSMRAGAMGGMLPPVGGITYIFQGQGYKTIIFYFHFLFNQAGNPFGPP